MPRVLFASRSTRRCLLALAVASAGMYLAGLVTSSAFDVGGAVPGRPAVGASGLFYLDKSRTDDGYVSIGVQGGESVQLVAKDGRVVHTWHLGHTLNTMATMYPDGSLLYLGGVAPPANLPHPPPKAGAAGIIEQPCLGLNGSVVVRGPIHQPRLRPVG